ncbi:uncharacterized protein LOC134238279 isoform X3 [Saccostrea cucullata]|uniref:uncharacterized protein LOC133191359 isoform X2 n=1 Tax=Saccostrea echinata TaxID=191078 RepID=UPI002A80F39A|nr:uncharacterized protein LOC133191359 isoform X2 [Saccostrea echinata]
MALAPQPNPDFTSETILRRYRPLSRHNIGGYETTYGNMNDWMKVSRNGVPVTMSDNNWHNLKKSEQKEHDLQFKKAFSNLTNKIAYRYPNPGNPRQRQGRIGGSWRHIKEVLGHGGSRVVYVDGLISVYDSENFNQALTSQVPMMPHIKNKVSPETKPVGESVNYPPVQPASPSYQGGDVARKMGLNVSPKYKGFYRYGAN